MPVAFSLLSDRQRHDALVVDTLCPDKTANDQILQGALHGRLSHSKVKCQNALTPAQ